MERQGYRAALGATVAATVAPYGYTLTVWTTGAVIAHAHGIPDAVDALLFLLGAVTAFTVLAVVTLGTTVERLVPVPTHTVIWGGLHFVAVGLAIAAAWAVSDVVADAAVWPAAGAVGTGIYLPCSALQLQLARALGVPGPRAARARRRRRPGRRVGR